MTEVDVEDQYLFATRESKSHATLVILDHFQARYDATSAVFDVLPTQ